MKFNKELLHAIVDHLHLASHQPDSQQPNYKKIRNLEGKKLCLKSETNKKIHVFRQVHVSAFARGRHSLSSFVGVCFVCCYF